MAAFLWYMTASHVVLILWVGLQEAGRPAAEVYSRIESL